MEPDRIESDPPTARDGRDDDAEAPEVDLRKQAESLGGDAARPRSASTSEVQHGANFNEGAS